MKKDEIDGQLHEIDGIVELNHPAPFWWQMMFYLSIVWAIGYGGYYLLGDGPPLREELARKLAKLETEKVVKKPSSEETGKELRAIYAAPERLAAGHAVFAKNCASCHAADGGGGIGPNLVDRHWLHGDGSIDAIYNVVRDGVLDKGMPAWGSILKDEEALGVAAYVRSIRGASVAKPKDHQGEPTAPTNEI